MSGKKEHIALLTGATGFIGGHLARALIREGWSLHILVRKNSNLENLKDIDSELQIHIHDGSTENLLEIFSIVKPEIVFHLASLFLAEHSSADIEGLIRSNILFSTQLLEAMVSSHCRCFINSGTSWEHFQNSTYNPINLYAATKQAFEAIIEYYITTTPLKTVTLKLFDSYGPADLRPKLFTLLRKVAREGKPFAMSSGDQLIDLVYIDDIVRAYLLAAARLFSAKVNGHERYAISSGQPIRLRKLVEVYSKVTGKGLQIEWGARPYRMREVMIPWQNGASLPGWKPEVGLEEGIIRMEM